MIRLTPNKYFYNFKLIFFAKERFSAEIFRNKKVQATHEKYRWWNNSTVVFSCWADLARPSAGMKTAQKTCAAMSFSLLLLI